MAPLNGLASRAVASVRLRASRVPRYLISLRLASQVAMQRADPELPAKRPRSDGSPRTPPSTRPAAANASPSPGSELHIDLTTWDVEDVCSFLKTEGFQEKKVLDSFRGNRAEGLRGWAEGGKGLRPRGREGRTHASGIRSGRPLGEAAGGGNLDLRREAPRREPFRTATQGGRRPSASP